MVAFVSITFLFSSSQLVEIKIRGSGRWKIRRWTAGLHTTLQIICVNCVFLRLRMYLERGHEKDASISLPKMLLSFALISLRYDQSASVVVVTITKLDFE